MSEFYFLMGVLQLGVIGAVVGVAAHLDSWTLHARRWALAWFGLAFVATAAWMLVIDGKSYPARELGSWVRVSVGVLVVIAVLLVLFARLGRVGLACSMAIGAIGASSATPVIKPWVMGPLPIASSAYNRNVQAAGRWINSNVPENALLATNKHCAGKEATVCRSNQWWLSGLGGRRVLVDGWSYVPASANEKPFFDLKLLSENQASFSKGDAAALARLKARGVSYLVGVKGATALSPELVRGTQKVYGNPTVNVYRIR